MPPRTGVFFRLSYEALNTTVSVAAFDAAYLGSIPREPAISLGNFANQGVNMDDLFVLIGRDNQGNLTAPIAKKSHTSYDDAVDHARTVLYSNGNMNLVEIYVMSSVAIARRASPPVEIIPVLRHAVKAA